MTIMWQRQEPKECWITALAMVTGKTLTELHDEFTTLAGLPYHEAKAQTGTLLWWETVNTMHKRYHLQGQEGSNFGTTVIETPILEGTQTRYLTKGLLHGKGILGVHFLKKYAHAVAFEDGEILDPEIEGRLNFKEWKRHYGLNTRRYTWRIDRAVDKPVEN
jgi:hypothetical protein